jgi:hypothetical protein
MPWNLEIKLMLTKICLRIHFHAVNKFHKLNSLYRCRKVMTLRGMAALCVLSAKLLN